MNQTSLPAASRRHFLKSSGGVAAAALAGVMIPRVHAAESNVIQVALVGCGGRGSGAAANALSVDGGPLKLVAMADIFENRLRSSYEHLKQGFGDKVDVPEERRFVGFDGYKRAMDCLNAGDVAIFATPPAFRWVHFGYAIEKNLHVFMEKPISVDGPTTRKMLSLADEAGKKSLKVGVGLMCRHSKDRIELHDRIVNGEIGQIIAMRTYRLQGPEGYSSSEPKPQGVSELMYQVQRFHSFLWASGGVFSDFYIHNIDECCWMKDAWPVQAKGNGGRHFRNTSVDQNFDNYSVEYTFADGTKLFLYGRTVNGCYAEQSSFAHGAGGMALVSINGHSVDKCQLFRGQAADSAQSVWKYSQPKANPYQLEWNELVDAIRQDKPYNETRRGAEASLVTSMGRMAAHTGKVITYEDMLNCDHEFAPDVDKLTMDSSAPLLAGPDGKYAVPQPGITTQREF